MALDSVARDARRECRCRRTTARRPTHRAARQPIVSGDRRQDRDDDRRAAEDQRAVGDAACAPRRRETAAGRARCPSTPRKTTRAPFARGERRLRRPRPAARAARTTAMATRKTADARSSRQALKETSGKSRSAYLTTEKLLPQMSTIRSSRRSSMVELKNEERRTKNGTENGKRRTERRTERTPNGSEECGTEDRT